MSPQHYLCSALVPLHCCGVARTVNLEEIWESGAVMEAEEPFPTLVPAEIRIEGATLCGRLIRVDRHDCGWRIEMQFSPMTLWSIEKFCPDHLLDLNQVGSEAIGKPS